MSENGQTHFKTLQSKGLSNYNFKFETGEYLEQILWFYLAQDEFSVNLFSSHVPFWEEKGKLIKNHWHPHDSASINTNSSENSLHLKCTTTILQFPVSVSYYETIIHLKASHDFHTQTKTTFLGWHFYFNYFHA